MADYKVELPNADPIMVRANNRAQAIRYATHKLVKIESLTTEEAIRLAKAGQELQDATSEPEGDQGAPLLDKRPLMVGDVVIVGGDGHRATIDQIIDADTALVLWFEGDEAMKGEESLANLTLAPAEQIDQEEPQKPAGRQRGGK